MTISNPKMPFLKRSSWTGPPSWKMSFDWIGTKLWRPRLREEVFHLIVIDPNRMDIFRIMGEQIVEPEGAHNELTDAVVEDSLENEGKVLIQNIKDILGARNSSLRHSLREGNQCADFMAKIGASADDVFTVHSSPPDLLLPLLRADEIGFLYLRI
ncbi:hypothetical protein MTR_1g040395 [Medicago truncatula]|uniref:RNase H type-1 domain-containing protein n=1 Tax=Medicago truncatula TaxID=3880 RepID=A0A072VHT3_MEDTR|nr:hypothetical protein MTR_1g040395 [Medicago truncatula]